MEMKVGLSYNPGIRIFTLSSPIFMLSVLLIRYYIYFRFIDVLDSRIIDLL